MRIPDARTIRRDTPTISHDPVMAPDRSARFKAQRGFASALGDTAKVIEEVRDTEDEFAYNRAKNKFLIEKRKLDAEFDELGEDKWDEAEDEYRRKISELRGSLAESIRDPVRREAFSMDSEYQAEDGALKGRAKIRTKVKERDKQGVLNDLEGLDEIAQGGQFGVASERARETLNAGLANGTFDSQEEVDAAYDKWAEGAALRAIESLPVEDRVAALDQPWAKKHMDPVVRRGLIDKASGEREDLAAQAAVESAVERLRAGEDERSVLNWLESSTTDPKVRKKARDQFFTEMAREEKLIGKQAESISSEHYDDILSGEKTVDDIPEADRDFLAAKAPKLLNSMYVAQRKAETEDSPYPKYNDPKVVDDLEKLISRAPPMAARKYFLEHGHLLSQASHQYYARATNVLLGKEKGGAESAFTVKDRIKQKVADLYPNDNQKNKREIIDRTLRQEFDAWYMKEQGKDEKGDKPTDAEINDWLKAQTAPRRIYDRSWINHWEDMPAIEADALLAERLRAPDGSTADKWEAIHDYDRAGLEEQRQKIMAETGQSYAPKDEVVRRYMQENGIQ